ncbi:hypothetical protein J7T55_010793 [Diaporthe amygdali]|uniref:uncharacterized protein n=1 Tax=Phomopsis amygdali TaxID=1214568 RepID=UPI0022FE0D24|nr:uncharacterized protein J7T55_010793 [Diaporthe amygdali]KAJ0114404.1 hypothetical protein J7T55_010793 [Diaporthe amygdali]
MPNQTNPSQFDPPDFLLNAINLEVKCARQTYLFLRDVFGQAVSTAPSSEQQIPCQVSPDGKQAIFQMANMKLHFNTATSAEHAVEGRSVSINVLVNDVNNVRRVLAREGVEYKTGIWEEGPGRPKWLTFVDLDGYNWSVGDLVKL